MLDRLTAEIERVRSDKSIPTLDEASVKQGIILRILNILDWNTFDIKAVKPEHSVGGGKVDYSLRLDGKDKVFLEAKRPSEDLSMHQEQLLNYSFRQGVSLAVLTNGLDWWFYLPLREGGWEERRFRTINLRIHDMVPAVVLLTRCLSRDNVSSGEAVRYAEAYLNISQIEKKTEEALPKAWADMLTYPDERLVDLLGKKVEELYGWPADQDQIKRFLGRLPKPGLAPLTPSPVPIASRSQMSPERFKSNVDYTSTRPLRFTFRGQTHQIKDRKWNTLLPTLAEQIYQLHPTEFHKAHEVKLRWLTYFSHNPQGMRTPKLVGSSGYYVETKMKANRCIKVCHELLAKFGYSPDDLQIETA